MIDTWEEYLVGSFLGLTIGFFLRMYLRNSLGSILGSILKINWIGPRLAAWEFLWEIKSVPNWIFSWRVTDHTGSNTGGIFSWKLSCQLFWVIKGTLSGISLGTRMVGLID